MKITFFGAAQNVTGSKHLIETKNSKILLDCGLYQGRRREANELNQKLPFAAADIDDTILSHAHADHCGLLPLLVKQGFRGRIFTTPTTADLAALIMRDSAKIQEQDANYLNDNLPVGEDPVAPLYTEADAAAVTPHFQPVDYFRRSQEWLKINNEVRLKFYDAGHIIGSAMAVLEIKESDETKYIGFTGDIGKPGAPLLRAPEVIQEPLDLLISESTYGNRNHRPREAANDDLERLITYAVKHKSKIIVPAFALGRTQELIYNLHRLINDNKIPRLPIYIDSPLAINLGEVVARHAEDFNDQVIAEFAKRGEKPFVFENLNYVHSVEESKELNYKEGPLMIISASGMCEGGRILHHLKNNIQDHNNLIVLTGYQGVNTLGRKLQNGISPVNIFGKPHPVHAQIVSLDEFSAHADRDSLLDYYQRLPHFPKRIALVHTELPQAESFKQALQQSFSNFKVGIPEPGHSLEI